MFPLDTKILVVEDTEITRRIICKMLSKLGFVHLVSAKDGVEAIHNLEIAVEARQPYGLVLADWKMPNMSGMELLHRIRRNHEMRALPVVMLTTITKREQVLDAISAGVTNYLAKPFLLEDLEKKLGETWEVVRRKKAS